MSARIRETVYNRVQYEPRPCMSCGQDFKSAGNNHRICNNCKAHSTRADGEYAQMEASDTIARCWK